MEFGFNEAKTQSTLKFVGVPQTRQPVSAVCVPKFTIFWRRLKEVLLFNRSFFPIVDTCLGEEIARQVCAMVRKWRFDFLS